MDNNSTNSGNHGGFNSREEFLQNYYREQAELVRQENERAKSDSNAMTMGIIALAVIIFIAIALGSAG